MKIILLTIIFILISFDSFAQIKNKEHKKAYPYPVIGWDSLSRIIERPENYPEILRRAGVNGSIGVSLLIDSTGTLVKVEPSFVWVYPCKLDSLAKKILIPAIEKMFESIKWHPGYKNNLPVNDKIIFSFNFYLIDEKGKGFNIIAPKNYDHIYY